MNVPYHGMVTYTNVLRNRDLVSDTYALFTDILPARVTFGQWLEQPDGVVQNGDTISWTGTISASTSITFTFTATHTSNYGDVITNTAYFSNATNSGSAEATFAVIPGHTLTLGYAGNGAGGVMANPLGPIYPAWTAVTLTATPSLSSIFTSWSGDVSGTADVITLTMDANKSITTTFMLRTFAITPAAGANGSIAPAMPQTVAYGAGQTFTITPDLDYHIEDVGVDGVSQGPLSFYIFNDITTNHTISAAFAINAYTLMAITSGNGSGTVTLIPPGPTYTAGTVVTLTAMPSPTSRFTGWMSDAITTTNPFVMVMDNDKTITATFVAYHIFLPLVLK